MSPLLAIAGELSHRGVPDLWFASEEAARGRVERVSGASPVRFASSGPTYYAPDESVYTAMTRGPRTTDGFVAAMRLLQHPSVAGEHYPWLLDLIDKLDPGLMVIDALHMPALDAAMTRRVPFVLSVPFPVSMLYLRRLPWSYPTPTSGLPRRMRPAQLAANVAFRLRLQLALLTRTNLLGSAWYRRSLGIANPFGDLERYSAAAAAVFGYSVFGIEYPFSAPDHLHMLGTAVEREAPGASTGSDLASWLDEHPSVVYVGLGTLAVLSRDQVTALATALADLGPRHRVLWKLPAAQRALLPGPPPAHVRLEEWLPSQSEVLAHPHVRVFVTHGGANGFHEGIHFGKPLLVMPFWLDCYDLAARGVDAGVGLAVDRPPHFGADEITAKLRRLLSDDTFARRSRYWGEQLRQAGGARRAADLIVELAGGAAAAH
ncbi:glycosyltransferase [Micromonospora eburnea]|uniref:Polyene glycosyltransferase n=1 Tax=Micromonospora eburnea TaxID=227316 RepID=A0A1C6UT89_9ACTN|nr:glycosyltransferase [Micromonospora eburnea]SCL57236.1 polyene glycosyltransferase [Micromonospora eburnea]